MDHNRNIGREIRALRESLSMSRRKFVRRLCELAGDPDFVTENALEQWETGRTEPRLKNLIALYAAANKTLPPLYTPPTRDGNKRPRNLGATRV